jgi:hypothetical protein
MGEHVEPGARSFGSPPLNYEFFRNLLAIDSGKRKRR